MSLIFSKLEKLQARSDGAHTARCPACAEQGNDRTGNHLIIFRDGRFGCAIFQGDGDEAKTHRRRIAALAGDGGHAPQKRPASHGARHFTLVPWRK